MEYIAAFDAGTTAVKGILTDGAGHIAASRSVNIPTLLSGPYKEQNPEDWWNAFASIMLDFSAEFGSAAIRSIVMSGQMQDLIPLDENLHPVGNAILYSDGRAGDEAEELASAVGAERLRAITGNGCDGSLPLAKLMWLKRHEPERFANIRHVLISSKDYLTARLTGECCGDVTACSAAGAMDIHRKCWDESLLAAAGVSKELFPRLYASHDLVGQVHTKAAASCGCQPGTPVYAGVGDAGATTLASGIARPGQFNINLGTSGWVAAVSSDVLTGVDGVFNLAAMPDGRYINVVPFLNAGNVHRWAAQMLCGAPGKAEPDYAGFEALLAGSCPGSGGVLFLPYLAGERFPVLDSAATGCWTGMTLQTTRQDLARACLEGAAFSLRQGLERLTDAPESISLIGGGGREPIWCQIISDVLGRDVSVFRNAEILPSLAVASAALLGGGAIESYEVFTASIQTAEHTTVYRPNLSRTRLYDELYRRYLRLYPAVQTIF